ncbi:Streptomycin 6-kinase [Alloactinosynnema sp. L-07]|uniref:aminoglycoside phosphotransferase family protein n=1 Tax=Alloactinosynnema sp. L-07 TaxID=1653480 RepID=UPI00065F05F2|nr:aminoglycoside phosphotransferase family protein [Alloactinosynnema sp. L-07]CRK61726.1 Streptomycin 6-kinase [Alloactinosynnema sp. L-07]
MLTVPADFADGFTEPDELRWIADLPDLATRCARRWDLTPDGEPNYGYVALVVPVRRADGSPAVLKLPWPHEEAEHEALTLSLWDGDGAVRLLAHEPSDWSMLLERLDPDTSLLDVPITEAIEVVAGLARRLDRPSPAVVRHVRTTAEQWADELAASDCAVPRELVEQAVAYCRELAPRAGNRLVNEDLHYENVLRGEREPWLVIDPKPIAGDPEFGVLALLWNRIDDPRARLDAVVAAMDLDHDLARRWSFVRAVETWVDEEDSPGARAVALALAE